MDNEKLKYINENGVDTFQFAVVGVTFDNRQSILKRIYTNYLNKEKIELSLEKDEQNIYDKYAIKINLKSTNENIGYVSKEFSEDISMVLNELKEVYVKNMYMNKTRNIGVIVKLVF